MTIQKLTNKALAITGIRGYIASHRLVRSQRWPPRSRDSSFMGSPTLSTATRSKASPLPNLLHEFVIVDDLASEDRTWTVSQAERAAWEFVRQVCGNLCLRLNPNRQNDTDDRLHIDFVSILPGINMGPLLHGRPSVAVAWMSGDPSMSLIIPNRE